MQSNDSLSRVLCHAFTDTVTSEAILFEDRFTTTQHPEGATFRPPNPGELADVSSSQEPWHGVVEVEGQIVAGQTCAER